MSSGDTTHHRCPLHHQGRLGGKIPHSLGPRGGQKASWGKKQGMRARLPRTKKCMSAEME